MREPFWLVVVVLLMLVVAGFAFVGSRGVGRNHHGAELYGMAQEFAGKLYGDVHDMTKSLADSLYGTRGADDPDKQ